MGRITKTNDGGITKTRDWHLFDAGDGQDYETQRRAELLKPEVARMSTSRDGQHCYKQRWARLRQRELGRITQIRDGQDY